MSELLHLSTGTGIAIAGVLIHIAAWHITVRVMAERAARAQRISDRIDKLADAIFTASQHFGGKS